MEWFLFMPPAAGLIELGWDNFIPNLFKKRAKKAGVFAETLSAGSNVVIDWPMYKKVRHIRKKLTQRDKEAYLKERIHMYYKYNPYKVGLGTFDVKNFTITLKHIILKLEVHFNVKFKHKRV